MTDEETPADTSPHPTPLAAGDTLQRAATLVDTSPRPELSLADTTRELALRPTDASRPGAELAHGYGLRYSDRDRALELLAPDGRMCVHITLAPEGPRIELRAASLAVRTERELAIECERLDIHAASGLALRTGGDLDLAATGDLRTEALAQHHRAHRGDIRLQAGDDVQLDGGRIRLNSPKPGTLQGQTP